jgi:hypothetical protein
MPALTNFDSFCVVSLLTVCACTYVRQTFPSLVTNKHGHELVIFAVISAMIPLIEKYQADVNIGILSLSLGRDVFGMGFRLENTSLLPHLWVPNSESSSIDIHVDCYSTINIIHDVTSGSTIRACAPKEGPRCRFSGLVYKATVIGTRLSPAVSLACIVMAVVTLFF